MIQTSLIEKALKTHGRELMDGFKYVKNYLNSDTIDSNITKYALPDLSSHFRPQCQEIIQMAMDYYVDWDNPEIDRNKNAYFGSKLSLIVMGCAFNIKLCPDIVVGSSSGSSLSEKSWRINKRIEIECHTDYYRGEPDTFASITVTGKNGDVATMKLIYENKFTSRDALLFFIYLLCYMVRMSEVYEEKQIDAMDDLLKVYDR